MVSKEQINEAEQMFSNRTNWDAVTRQSAGRIKVENEKKDTGIVFEFYKEETENMIGEYFGVGRLKNERGSFDSLDIMLEIAQRNQGTIPHSP